MRSYTAHLHDTRPPVIVPEAFSWAALFFGPLWLLLRGAWIPAILVGAAFAAACTLPPPAFRPLLSFGVLLLTALFGHDLRRLHLRLRRFELAHVVAARNMDEAWFRLLGRRPDLREQAF